MESIPRLVFFMLGFCLILAGGVQADAASCLPHDAESKSIKVDGYQRQFWFYRPCDDKNGLPLVLVLHGWGGAGDIPLRQFGWRKEADKQGFFVAFPSALPVRADLPSGSLLPGHTFPHADWHSSNDPSWWPASALRGIQNHRHPDDEHFLLVLIQQLLRTEHGDAKRVYIVGFRMEQCW